MATSASQHYHDRHGLTLIQPTTTAVSIDKQPLCQCGLNKRPPALCAALVLPALPTVQASDIACSAASASLEGAGRAWLNSSLLQPQVKPSKQAVVSQCRGPGRRPLTPCVLKNHTSTAIPQTTRAFVNSCPQSHRCSTLCTQKPGGPPKRTCDGRVAVV